MGDDVWRANGRDRHRAPRRPRELDDQHEARYAAFDVLTDLAREHVMTAEAAVRAYQGLEAIVAKPDLSSLDRWAESLTAPERWAATLAEPAVEPEQLRLFG